MAAQALRIRHSQNAFTFRALQPVFFLWIFLSRDVRVASMSGRAKAIGRGLFLAGVALISLYLLGLYLRGPETLREAFDPSSGARTYLIILLLVPGALLIWLPDFLHRRLTMRSR